MTLAKKLTLALLLMIASGLAVAEEKSVTFKLNRDTYFGNSLLTSGEYRLRVLSSVSNVTAITNLDGSRTVMVVPTTRGYESCEHSKVTVSSSNTGWSLDSVCFSGSETTLYFPKVKNHQVASASAVTQTKGD
ncbi:MAG TPA: hypothetical protein VN577_21460 [Terriglobales bacterium]|nr:hypothetical protein [Terriglobales bacterium]